MRNCYICNKPYCNWVWDSEAQTWETLRDNGVCGDCGTAIEEMVTVHTAGPLDSVAILASADAHLWCHPGWFFSR